jgi:citrate synthase
MINVMSGTSMPWMTSEQALAALGTKPQSLYASVSRGRIRARPDPADARKSLYDQDDIERLAQRAAGRRAHQSIAADAIRWGDPVLPTSISTIVGGALYYRGRDAIALAAHATLEQVATLLWEAPRMDFVAPSKPAVLDSGGSPLHRAFAALTDRASADPPAHGRARPDLQVEAAGLVGTLAVALGAAAGPAPLHRRLAAAWRRPEAAQQLRRALVLLDEHELNASTFAARITASTGASLAAALLSGLATLTGPLHGNAAAGVAELVTRTSRDGAASLAAWGIRDRPLPGFGHRLYPGGDPRAAAMLADFALPPAYAAFAALGRDLTGEAPNIDFALAALAAAFTLPADAPLTLFALARSVGWLAHALEQIETGTLIRPRANYVGVAPAVENDDLN